MIKRYMWSFAEKFGQGLFISDKGDYVKFEDYANLRKELDLLQAEVQRLNATAQSVSDGLYRIANHIAGAKNSLPQEWQDWAEEIESDLRKLSAAKGGQDD